MLVDASQPPDEADRLLAAQVSKLSARDAGAAAAQHDR